MVTTRIADTRFVLDQLEVLAAGGNPDAEGHALPWTSAAVNLEGYLDYMSEKPGQEGELFPIARYAVDRSLLLAGTDGFRDERFGRSWSAMLAHGGCTRCGNSTTPTIGCSPTTPRLHPCCRPPD
jgi:hypothetical protein